MFYQVWQYFSDPDIQKFVFYILAVLIFGLSAGRLSETHCVKYAHNHRTRGYNTFFKGIQYLIPDDPNHTIEEFSKSVQVNPETIETYEVPGKVYYTGRYDR